MRKVALFIDGAHLHECARSLSADIDFLKLRHAFPDLGEILRPVYFAPSDEELGLAMRPLLTWLSFNGYDVVGPAPNPRDAQRGRRHQRRSISVAYAVRMLQFTPYVRSIVMFAGDDNFRPLVEAAQRGGTRVLAVSSLRSSPALIGDILRRQVDQFIEIAEVLPRISRWTDKVLAP